MEESKFYTIMTVNGTILQGIFIRELENYIVFGEFNCPQVVCKQDIKMYKELDSLLSVETIERRFREWKQMK